MSIGPYLEKNQTILYRTFSRALERDRVAHAYLLSGEVGAPLKESALFLAKSLICDSPSPLADESCLTCLRVDHGTFNDLKVVDGSRGTIKKEDVQNILGDFAKTPLESKNRMIYIINLVENMTTEAVNSLLKFLEEPGANTYAFLTTENEAKLLPTIISRCETIRMRLAPREDVIKEAVELGVDKEDAELLSFFCNSGELVLDESEEEGYLKAKKAFLATLRAFQKDKESALYDFETSIVKDLQMSKPKQQKEGDEGRPPKPSAPYYIEMLTLAFKDMASEREKQPIKLEEYATLIKPLAERLPHIEESLLEIMQCRGLLNLNVNPQLVGEHLAHYILEEKIDA